MLRRLWLPPEAHFAEARDQAENALSLIRLGIVVCFLGITLLALSSWPTERVAAAVQFTLVALSASATAVIL